MMHKLPIRLRLELVVGLALCLGGCTKHTVEETYNMADVANANASNALDLCHDLESRLSDVEARLDM